MERPNNQPARTQPEPPAHRDMMFCHECADEWYRDQHGLTCPECGSDFTEVIEEGNDPRDSVMFADGGGGEHDSMPDLEDAHPHLDARHNPWADNDPAEGDISDVHFTQTAPGRFHVNATITRSMSPQEYQGPMGGFMSMLNGFAQGAAQQAQQPQGQNQSALNEARNQGQDGQPRVSRFTYTRRNDMNPSYDDMNNILAGLMATFGALPGGMHGQPGHGPRVQVRIGGRDPMAHDHGPDMPPNAFFDLFRTVGILPPNAALGDFVSSQEGLDRIISQLMEQTATSNAPGPAPQSDIDNLPRKKVDEDMLGAEHKAECSICMDEVNIGEEVTVLPCKHWFHHQCVSAWLSEHDTCPHCRKGITKQPESALNNSSSNAHPSQATGSRAMPGAFDVSATHTQPSSSDNTNAGNGGIGDRIRRGLWGPPQ